MTTRPTFVLYRVTLETPTEVITSDLSTTLGPDAAGRRAHIAAVDKGHGTLNEVRIVSVERVCRWLARCKNIATQDLHHPVLGAVPACDRCVDLVTAERMSDDDPLLTVKEAAARAEVKPVTWRWYVKHEYAPAPDVADLSTPANRRTPKWRTSTVDAYIARPKKPGKRRDDREARE